jgi:hypothetical protein
MPASGLGLAAMSAIHRRDRLLAAGELLMAQSRRSWRSRKLEL